MGIQNDAGEILIYAYNKYTSNPDIHGNFVMLRCSEILNETKWDSKRLERAVFYLSEKGLVSIIYGLGAKIEDIFIGKIFPSGIDVVESKAEFKRNFGFEAGIPGVFKFSWGFTEK